MLVLSSGVSGVWVVSFVLGPDPRHITCAMGVDCVSPFPAPIQAWATGQTCDVAKQPRLVEAFPMPVVPK